MPAEKSNVTAASEKAETALENPNSNAVTNAEGDNKKRKGSDASGDSNQSFKSTSSLLLSNGQQTGPPLPPTTKADIEKLEQSSNRKFSAEIDAISEKLYHLNNVVKMNKDIETIAKENLIRSDILKKLNMKEKWLADKQIGVANPIVANTKFEEKVDKILQPASKLKDDISLLPKSKFSDQIADPYAPKSKFKDVTVKPRSQLEEHRDTPAEVDPFLAKSKLKDDIKSEDPKVNENQGSVNVLQQIKELINKENVPSKKPPSRSNSFKSNAGISPLLKPKTTANANPIKGENKMEIENILNIVKNIEISKSESAAKDVNKSNTTDMGKLLYKVEAKFSPKPNRKMSEKLKEIEAKNFSGTLDSIKSQMETPTISAQTVPPNVDLSKYFPNQKSEKSTSTNVNKNQKALNEVDLTKYFPSSPVPQRRASVVTVADKLRKCQTEKSLDSPSKVNTSEKSPAKAAPTDPKQQGPSLVGSTTFSLKDNQLDGAIDIVKMKPNAKVVTTAAVATTGKKGKNVKIIKKIVRKGSINKNKSSKAGDTKSIIPRDEDDLILDEILQNGKEELRSPSWEYQQLFQEEKSPSEDISDKIELILEETGIDLGLSKKTSPCPNKKVLLKAKSFGEGEMQLNQMKNAANDQRTLLTDTKEEADLPSGVQNILKRFESMSSMPGEDHSFKLRRMESTTSNLNKSKESIVSRESETFSDLEKTMEYLKSEWKSEATNFLQKKRDDFNNKNKKTVRKHEISENTRLNDAGAECKNSKIAKFFGLKAKSPEKKKSPIKKKRSPEKKIKQPLPAKETKTHDEHEAIQVKVDKLETKASTKQKAKPSNTNKNIIYASLEELALVQVSQQLPKPKEEVEDVAIINQDNEQTKETTTTVDSKSTQDDMSAKRSVVEAEDIEIINQDNEKIEQAATTADTNSTQDDVSAKRPLVEDIRNLPKTGCDKSLSNSRRGSLSSLQSRRLSNASNGDKIEMSIDLLGNQISSDIVAESPLNKPIVLNDNYDEDSLCTSISKSPSIPPTTVQLRGSSEDESIENLFSQFSDEMLVNVEFDSNDELIEIIPVTQETNDNPDENKKTISVEVSNRASEDVGNDNSEVITIAADDNNIIQNLKVSPTSTNAGKLHVPLKMPSALGTNFPTRPQRRQKSSSSSSDYTPPLAPQRIKKKLSKISPSSMPPSVQDLLQQVYKNNTNVNETPQEEQSPSQTAKPLRFPRLVDEDDILLEDIPIVNKMFTHKTPKNLTTQNTNTEGLKKEPIIITTNYLNDGFEYGPNKLENVTEFTKVLTPIMPTQENTDSEDTKEKDIKIDTVLKEPTTDWNMEMLPNSPMPRPRNAKHITKPPSIESLSETGKLDWNMEMLPNSPMPRRKSGVSKPKSVEKLNEVETKKELVTDLDKTKSVVVDNPKLELASEKNNQVSPPSTVDNTSEPASSLNNIELNSMIKEKSPTSSIKLLNKIDVNAEDSQKRLIEEFELERRHSLIERDKHYNVMEKPDVKPPPKQSRSASGSSSSKLTTPLSTPAKQSPRDSRRSSQQSSNFNRGGTPPMMKPLEIAPSSPAQSSRRSSFAFIELLDNKPIVAPMPKKLDLPKIEDKVEIPDNLSGPLPDDMKKRPWPKNQDDSDTDDDNEKHQTDAMKGLEPENIEYANIHLGSGPRRQWPDGKTVFDKNKKEKIRIKPRSETPEMSIYSRDVELEETKPSSKSTTDLSKLSTPYTSNHSLATTTRTQKSMSSNDSESNPRANKSLTPQRPVRHQKFNATPAAVDASTQMLLDRSKRLHNRKRDFVNERVVERNPYMRDVIDAERRNSLSGGLKNDSDDEEVGTYRPRYYSNATSSSRFPSSRALGRSHVGQHYDYVPTYSDGASAYTSSSSRRLPTVTPLSSLNSNYTYKPYTSSAVPYSTGRNLYMSDFSRRSPSLMRERGSDLSRESCVLC